MESKKNRIWGLSLAIIVISGIELILTILIALTLSVGAQAILSNESMQGLAVKVNRVLEENSIEVGTLNVSMTSQDGTIVGVSNVPNISLKVLYDSGVIDENGQLVGTTLQTITAALLSVSITAAIIAILLSSFTFIIAFLILAKSGKPQKYGSILVWSIICAILCFCVGRWVLTVLFIIIAVSAGSNRAAPEKGIPSPSPAPAA